jgi:hypothetical protein
MRRSLLGTAALFVILALAGCGSDASNSGENYGNILNSPAGLILVQEEHEAGWGRSECFSCHVNSNIHIVNRTGDPTLDLGAIQDLVAAEGTASCPLCHGNNGVQP